MILAATTGPSALWFLTRGTGAVALILLTLSVAIGVANVRRVHTDYVPRFALQAVHRDVSLLAVAFVVVHVATSVLDSFAPIHLIDIVVPFGSVYRPLWLGLGAVAFDLLIAIALTSLLRQRLGYSAWRATHWLAYVSWPVALLHGLGTGSDTKTTWMLTLAGVCVAVMVVAVVARAAAGWPGHRGARVTAIALSTIGPLALLVWLPSGPLAPGWAKRAGTPSYLLASASSTALAQPSSGAAAQSAPGGSPSSFTAPVSGTASEEQLAGGLASVDISLIVAGQQLSALDMRIVGQPFAGGGLEMSTGSTTLGTAADPTQYRGSVIAVDGANIQAKVTDSNSGTLTLLAQLQLVPGSGAVTGTLTVNPGGGQ